MSACADLVSTITNHPNLAPIRRVGHQALGIGLPIKKVDDDDQKPNFKLLGSLQVILMAINLTTCQQDKPQKVLFARQLIVFCNVLPHLDHLRFLTAPWRVDSN